jgi:hypothetical protein
VSLAVLTQSQYLTTAFVTYATGNLTIIDKATATNISDVDVTVDIALVQFGESATAANTVMRVSIPAGQAYLCGEVVGHVLAVGDFISAKADTAGSVVFRVSGRSA